MFGLSAPLISYVSLALWALVVVCLAPSFWRYLRGPYNLVDSYRTGMFFGALMWCGGLGRLVFWPHNEGARSAILMMSCAVAIYKLVLARQGAVK